MLLFLFGESFLGIYVIGFFALFLLAYSWTLDFSRVALFKKEFLFWFLFILGLFLSSFYTHSLPLTVNALIFYLFSFAIFSFFILMKRSLFHINFLFWNLILVVLGLGLIGWLFSLWPGLAENLPGMNLLYATYGHNHYGALMIIFIPISWYYILKNLHDKGKFTFFLFSLVFMVASLIMSFGRAVILLGLLELVILFLLTVKITPWIGRKLKFLFTFLLIGMLGAFLIKNSFSVLSYLNNEINCPLPMYKDKICKNVSTDLRFSYWQTALRASFEHPVVGYGPGTYRLISERYKTRPDSGTSYAHNNLLQLAAEGGLVLVGSFLLLMSQLFFRSIRLFERNLSINIEKKRITNWRLFVVLGLVVSFINSLVDFDWSFIGILIVNLILFVVVIRGDDAKHATKIKINIAKFFYSLSIFVLISLMAISIAIEFLLAQGNHSLAFRIFPYFQSHMQIFLDSKSLTPAEKKSLKEIYSEVPYIYQDVLKKTDDRWLADWKHLQKIAPWSFYETNSTNNGSELDLVLLKSELIRTADLYIEAKRYGYKGLVSADVSLSKQSVKLADYFLGNGDYLNAANLYKLATVYDQWVFNDTYPRFLYDVKTYEQKLAFWEKMEIIPSTLYGKHTSIVGGIYFSILRTAVDKHDIDRIEHWHKKLLEVAPWSTDDLSEKILPEIQAMADGYVKKKEYQVAERLLLIAAKIGTYYSKLQLGNFYLLIGDAEKAMQVFHDCDEWWKENNNSSHDNCYLMLQKYDQNNNSIPYWSTSRAIREVYEE